MATRLRECHILRQLDGDRECDGRKIFPFEHLFLRRVRLRHRRLCHFHARRGRQRQRAYPDHACIGTGAIIKQGTPVKPLVIGEDAVVGMGAVVTKDVPAYTTVVGNPAKPFVKS